MTGAGAPGHVTAIRTVQGCLLNSHVLFFFLFLLIFIFLSLREET